MNDLPSDCTKPTLEVGGYSNSMDESLRPADFLLRLRRFVLDERDAQRQQIARGMEQAVR